MMMTMMMSLLMMIDDDDVDARETDTPLYSLGVSQAPITYFFLFSNKLLMKIIWEWPPLFSLIGFSIGCNFEFDIKVHCDLPFIKHSFFLKFIFLLSQAWYIEFLTQKYLWHITKHFHNLFLHFVWQILKRSKVFTLF